MEIKKINQTTRITKKTIELDLSVGNKDISFEIFIEDNDINGFCLDYNPLNDKDYSYFEKLSDNEKDELDDFIRDLF